MLEPNRARYLEDLSYVTRSEDVEIEPNFMFSVKRKLYPRSLRLRGSSITCVLGPFTAGKTLYIEAIVEWLRLLGYNAAAIAETATREEREWEEQFQFVHTVTEEAYEVMLGEGDLIVAYRRRRGRGGNEKRGGLWVPHVIEQLLHHDFLLMAINALALLRLDDIFSPPITPIVLMSTPEDHKKMQRMRGVSQKDGAGINAHGLVTGEMRIPGTLWLQNIVDDDVLELNEAERREIMKPRIIQRLNDPPTRMERRFFDPQLNRKYHAKTRGELLLDVLLRSKPEREEDINRWPGLVHTCL